jgi:hypothetical protein
LYSAGESTKLLLYLYGHFGKTTVKMNGYWQTCQGQMVIPAAILIVSAVLIFANLSNQNLWQDEAETGFEQVTIDYPDISFENRENPDQHLFRTNTTELNVVIFKKVIP